MTMQTFDPPPSAHKTNDGSGTADELAADIRDMLYRFSLKDEVRE
jgi:hypothetical protein